MCILVGREGTPYYLHSEVLEQKSPYFANRAAFLVRSRPGHSDGADSIVDVHWERVTCCEVFSLLVEYLYQDGYATPESFSIAKKCEAHAQLYRLAEHLMMHDLRDMALNKLAALLKENAHAYIGRTLKPQEILRLLHIAYGDQGDERGSILPAETEDIGNPEDHEPHTEMIADPCEDQVSPPAQVTEERLDAESHSHGSDPLQQLVARYAAVQLESLQKEPAFGQIVVDGGHMVRDIMLAARPAGTM